MMVPSRPSFEPFNLLSLGDCREMCFIIGCICSLYCIYIRDNLLLYQEIWVKYWVSKFKEGELKSEIAAMYLRFPFPHPLEIQSPVYPEVICSNAKPIYIYSSRDAVLSYVQSGDVCRFGKTNVLACTLAPYQSEVSIKTVRHLFKCLRRENCFGDDSGEGDLSHFVAILPTTSFRDGPRFHLGGQTVQFFWREGGVEFRHDILAFGKALFIGKLADGLSCDWNCAGEDSCLERGETASWRGKIPMTVRESRTPDAWRVEAMRYGFVHPVRPSNMTPMHDYSCQPLLSGNLEPSVRHKAWKRFMKKIQEKRRSFSKLFSL
ncbi:E protein [Agrobacterium tumefaciens]|nr:hypothetical protein [Agrobacterium genomosp. 6]NTA14175.1 E protein [Agrobacterium tumefaciens]